MYIYKRKNGMEEWYLLANCSIHLGNWKELKDVQCLKKNTAMCFPGYQTIKQKAGTIMNSDATQLHDGLHWVESAKWNFKVIENVKYRGEGKKRGERSKMLCYKRLPSNSCTHMVASPRPRSPFSWYIHTLSSISVVTDRRLFVHCQMAHAMCQTILFFF